MECQTEWANRVPTKRLTRLEETRNLWTWKNNFSKLILKNEPSHQADEERGAVEEHVEGVGDESERVAPESVEQLDEGERQVDDEEPEEVAGVAVGKYQTVPR